MCLFDWKIISICLGRHTFPSLRFQAKAVTVKMASKRSQSRGDAISATLDVRKKGPTVEETLPGNLQLNKARKMDLKRQKKERKRAGQSQQVYFRKVGGGRLLEQCCGSSALFCVSNFEKIEKRVFLYSHKD